MNYQLQEIVSNVMCGYELANSRSEATMKDRIDILRKVKTFKMLLSCTLYMLMMYGCY